MSIPLKNQSLPPVIFLMGPTASGKTALAVELAQRFPVELISVDSALVYRDMNIGTAKPEPEILARAPHHLIDIIDPTESYSAATFRREALALMTDITARGRVPLLVGGTMLYFRALRFGLSELPPADAEIRAEIEQQATQIGWPALHAELAKVDAITAARLAPNDSQRINRALEIFRISGSPMSQLIAAQETTELPFQLTPIALITSDRSVLHQRIAIRFKQMLANGLLDEVKSLQAKYALNRDLPSMRCVGYRQAWEYLAGEISEAELLEKGIAATRQLAKRQLTWLRGMPDNLEFDCLDLGLVEKIVELVEERV
jgi:tRNA dimethylallyltransferase